MKSYPRQFCLINLSRWEREIVDKYPFVYLEPGLESIRWYNFDRRRAQSARWMDVKPCPEDDVLPSDNDFCALRYGFEFDKGWAELADEIGRVANALVVHLRATVQPKVYIRSCIFKEKFGELRWQGHDNLDEPFSTLFHVFVANIEERSTRTCEVTGKKGKLRDLNGCYKTLCQNAYLAECRKRNITPIDDDPE